MERCWRGEQRSDAQCTGSTALPRHPAGLQHTHKFSLFLSFPSQTCTRKVLKKKSPTNKQTKIPHYPQPDSWFPLDVTRLINILFFLTYLLLFFLSLSHVPASRSPPESRPKLRRKALPSFEWSILSRPGLLAEQDPGMMELGLSSLPHCTSKAEVTPPLPPPRPPGQPQN